MSKFNVGDKVRVIMPAREEDRSPDLDDLYGVGEEGEIREGCDTNPLVYFPGQSDVWYVLVTELELVSDTLFSEVQS